MSFYAGMGKRDERDEPECSIDLHGMTTAACKTELDELLSQSKFSHVRVIIGKGKNSIHGPVLPDFVKNYLRSNQVRFEQSHPRDGGSGALEVFFD